MARQAAASEGAREQNSVLSMRRGEEEWVELGIIRECPYNSLHLPYTFECTCEWVEQTSADVRITVDTCRILSL